ncbi:hypothetical protein SmJEL517_g03467 [Synchytrium microbalum]|uniref:F-box domain-containing protein n=1 Tax=Synchytrium microbalum TaxID=1806994 RepID=A0A507C6U3_9FUNG|nr:uncharacterized protein SmJEL517_g03467 [Synchytrium microbalum]TPX33696.1 hypothetical protein SmJEL517_g03467 [Synchytrium microbalum]
MLTYTRKRSKRVIDSDSDDETSTVNTAAADRQDLKQLHRNRPKRVIHSDSEDDISKVVKGLNQLYRKRKPVIGSDSEDDSSNHPRRKRKKIQPEDLDDGGGDQPHHTTTTTTDTPSRHSSSGISSTVIGDESDLSSVDSDSDDEQLQEEELILDDDEEEQQQLHKRQRSLDTLPLETWRLLGSRHLSAVDLSRVAATSKAMSQLLQDDETWKKAVERKLPWVQSVFGISKRQVSLLLMNHACQVCKKSIGVHIYWQWKTRRCHACISDITVSTTALKDDHAVPQIAYQHLPSIPHKLNRARGIDDKGPRYLVADVNAALSDYEAALKQDAVSAWLVNVTLDKHKRESGNDVKIAASMEVKAEEFFGSLARRDRESLYNDLRNRVMKLDWCDDSIIDIVVASPSWKAAIKKPLPSTTRAFNALTYKIKEQITPQLLTTVNDMFRKKITHLRHQQNIILPSTPTLFENIEDDILESLPDNPDSVTDVWLDVYAKEFGRMKGVLRDSLQMDDVERLEYRCECIGNRNAFRLQEVFEHCFIHHRRRFSVNVCDVLFDEMSVHSSEVIHFYLDSKIRGVVNHAFA